MGSQILQFFKKYRSHIYFYSLISVIVTFSLIMSRGVVGRGGEPIKIYPKESYWETKRYDMFCLSSSTLKRKALKGAWMSFLKTLFYSPGKVCTKRYLLLFSPCFSASAATSSVLPSGWAGHNWHHSAYGPWYPALACIENSHCQKQMSLLVIFLQEKDDTKEVCFALL